MIKGRMGKDQRPGGIRFTDRLCDFSHIAVHRHQGLHRRTRGRRAQRPAASRASENPLRCRALSSRGVCEMITRYRSCFEALLFLLSSDNRRPKSADRETEPLCLIQPTNPHAAVCRNPDAPAATVALQRPNGRLPPAAARCSLA